MHAVLCSPHVQRGDHEDNNILEKGVEQQKADAKQEQWSLQNLKQNPTNTKGDQKISMPLAKTGMADGI